MTTEQHIIKQIKEQGLLPLFYHTDTNVCIEITKALYAAGVRLIEFTNRGENALENFKALILERDRDMKDLLLAVGTIRTAEQATQFINAGANFLISPVFDNNICDITYINKILWIPGCMTPTEIHAAEQAGCCMIKLFPGNVLGPSFVDAIKPLFPQLDFVVTGGVDTTAQNLQTWFKAGVSAVGMGSKLISKDVMEHRLYEDLTVRTKEVISIIEKIKSVQ
jgi:2-dehydro-3-deoxyphosphogluconate aldolase/(4S)-4-hydroxy-2-oxoglutarate aldolase